MTLYHSEIGFPPNFLLPIGTFKLEYGPHAKDAAADDVNSKYLRGLPIVLNVDKVRPQEIGFEGKRLVHLLYTINYFHRCLLTLAIQPQGGWFVKTLWTNHLNYKHHVDKSKYSVPLT